MIGTNIALTQAANVPVVPADTLAPVVVLPTMTSAPVLPTNTVAPAVSGVINYTANCRSGPGANFPVLVVLNPGAQVSITGTNKATDGSLWWVVQSAGNPDCWLVDGAVSITGNKGSVAVVVSPPTPTPLPIPTWTGTWTFWLGGGFDGAVDEIVTATFAQSGNTVTTSFTAWTGLHFVFTGTATADGMTVNGQLVRDYPPYSGNWVVVLKRVPGNINQFRGSWYWAGGGSSYDGAWCGATHGATEPSPCKTH